MPTKKHKITPALPKVELGGGWSEPLLTVPFLACDAGLIEPAEVLRLCLFGELEGAGLHIQTADFVAEAGMRDDDGWDSLELAMP